MSEERRVGRRTPISGVRVTYEGATGARIEADVLDLAAGGLFIRTDAPLAAGKRIALDLHILGESGPSSALGRVVWSRPSPEAGRPAGMGVKLIDVDDATLEIIERLVETREPTAPGVGDVPAVSTAPVVVAAPERERTLLGVGTSPGSDPPPPLQTRSPEPAVVVAADEPPASPPPAVGFREQSVAIDLVTHKKDKDKAPASGAPAPVSSPALRPSTPSSPPRADAGASSARWVVIGLLVVIAGIAAWVLFDGFLRPMGR